MKYYGNANRNRLDLMDIYPVEEINNPNTEAGYLYKKGMLFDFLVNRDRTTVMNIHRSSDYPVVYYEDCSQFKKKKYANEVYYIGVREVCYSTGRKQCYVLYRQLPRIANDDIFRWKDNLKYGSKETVIIQGNFEYTCIVKADGDAIIDVRYAKCDNKHRNKVTITRIEVINAANEEILNAIAEWKKVFEQEMRSTKIVSGCRATE